MGNSVVIGRKAIILTVFAALIVMFLASFLYRMSNPNLFVQGKAPAGMQAAQEDHDHDGDGVQDHGAAPSAMSGQMNGVMTQVREYMARVEKDPNDVEALIGLGNSFLMMRAWDRALEPLNKAHELQPKNVPVLKGIGIAQFNKENFLAAADAYKTILSVDEADTLALFNLGIINKHYFKKEDVARQYFEKVLELEKEDAEMIGLAKQELGQ